MLRKEKPAVDQSLTTVIAAGSKHVGTFSGSGNYIVYGEVEGDCDINGHLTLEDSAVWRGTVQADELIIAGTAEGDVIAKNKIKVTDTARVKGNLTGSIIEVAEGAAIQGGINITSGARPEESVLEFRNNKGSANTNTRSVE